MPETMPWTFEGSQFVGSFATTLIFELSAACSHFCQPSDSGLPGKPPRNAMLPDLTMRVHDIRERLAGLHVSSPTTVV